MVFTGFLTNAGSGTFTHDDGIALYNANAVPGNNTTGLVTTMCGTAAAPLGRRPRQVILGRCLALGLLLLHWSTWKQNGLPAELVWNSTGGSTSLSSTPIPAALPLFAGGLGLLGLFGRRRKRQRAEATAA